jgi:Spy/CpxP family protein refolding chaperone
VDVAGSSPFIQEEGYTMVRRAGIALAVVALGASLAFAQIETPAPPGMGGGQQMQKQRMVRVRANVADKLNLTDQQKKDMQKLRIDMEKKNTPLESQIRLARLEIQQLMLADSPDRAKIEKQMKEVSDVELKIKLNRLDHAFAVKGILTPEQQKIWRENRGGFGRFGGVGGPGEQRRIRIYRNSPMWGELDTEGTPEGTFDMPIGEPIEVETQVEVN